MRLNEKVAIITGAGSGQGKAAAKIFAAEGAKVVISEWNEESGKQVEREIREEGHEALFIKTDVSNEKDVIAMVEQVKNHYGKIDVLFNNAGIGYSYGSKYKMASILKTPLEDWNAILGINLNGVFLVTKYVLPLMIEQKRGSIVNNCSIAALVGEWSIDAYCASKGGIMALTRALAIQYGKYNIRINCVCPGSIDTPMVASVLDNPNAEKRFKALPLGRIGKPEEVAYAALFLASDEASYITGLVMPVDGGATAV
ncbi:MAG: SDR family NAD(P)-dependent oxidoreductase [Bacillota bacterium]